MMQGISIFMVSLLLLCSSKAPQAGGKLYHQMPAKEIDQDLRRVAALPMSAAEKMTYFSERFTGAPYLLVCEGEGENGLYETEPLLNLKKINCMTYCEIVLAMTLSRDYEEMFNVLQHIRYRDGFISMATRNHYTMVDWLPANRWCLDDVTAVVGGGDCATSTRTIRHGVFFKGKGIEDLPAVLPDRTVTLSYIPLDKLETHKSALRSGDIVSLIQDKPDIFSAHMLMIVEKKEGLFFRHASMSAGKVVDVEFSQYIDGLKTKPRYQGMCFMRVKEQVDWTLPGARRGVNPLMN